MQIRKPLRLQDYDYTEDGYYFITICTENRANLLCQIKERPMLPPRVELSEVGALVERYLQAITLIYEGYRVDRYVIMPNHIHMILQIERVQAFPKDQPSIPRVIQQFKGTVTKKIGTSIWQKSYHDHIIRDEADYRRIAEYMENNPSKWCEDTYYEP